MPSEKIQSVGMPGENDRPYLRVSWGYDSNYVQVASLFDPRVGADVVINTVNEWLKAAGLDEIPGREELNRLIVEKSGPDSIAGQFGIGFDGFHAMLEDRRSVNQLIQVGKRSRDHAFGRDE